ncbi:hypothetical protein AB0O58_02845 [Rhodococcus sp. NPDC080181]|uniref:hypothetical protein n=1 Tax=Rhodococcus sp. NPDC080181 TaxID=3155292 RepID=UPI0034510D15
MTVLSAGLPTIMDFGPVFVHSLRDSGTDPADPADPEQNFGLLRADFTHKSAFDVVRGRSAAIPAPLWGRCRGIPAAEPSSGAFCATTLSACVASDRPYF